MMPFPVFLCEMHEINDAKGKYPSFHVAAQREVKHLRERELQLQCDLTTASREISKLRTGLKQKLVRELPWPDLPQSLRTLEQGTPMKPSLVKIGEEEDKTWHI